MDVSPQIEVSFCSQLGVVLSCRFCEGFGLAASKAVFRHKLGGSWWEACCWEHFKEHYLRSEVRG